MERYYPVKTADGRYQALYEKYRELAAAEPHMEFIGRCSTYQYLDMDQVINQSLAGAERCLKSGGGETIRQCDVSALPELCSSGYDICIIGSGFAGTAVASELSGSGLRILLLESGGRTRQSLADALDEVESICWPRIEDQWLVRNRVVGGTSHTW